MAASHARRPLYSLLSRHFSSSPPPLPPPHCSPASLRKLVAAQPDPLLAHELFTLAASLRPGTFSPSSPAAYPAAHSLILKLTRSNHLSLASALLRRLPNPSPGLFSSLIKLHSDAGRPHLAAAAFRSMLRRARPRPSSRHLNRLLTALTATPNHLQTALKILVSDSAPADVTSHNILMAAFARAGRLAVAVKLFDGMLRRELTPDENSYRILIQGFCRKSQVNAAVDLLEGMFNRGEAADGPTFSTVLNSLGRKKKLREAYKLLCRMRIKGFDPDIRHYNTLVTGFCREGRASEAQKVFDEMSQRGVLPDSITFSNIVHGLCREGLGEEGRVYMEKMVCAGFVPHFSLLHAIVKGFCLVGKFEEGGGVVMEMMKLGVGPHVETWAVLVPGVCHADDFTLCSIRKVWEDALQSDQKENS